MNDSENSRPNTRDVHKSIGKQQVQKGAETSNYRAESKRSRKHDHEMLPRRLHGAPRVQRSITGKCRTSENVKPRKQVEQLDSRKTSNGSIDGRCNNDVLTGQAKAANTDDSETTTLHERS